jgi:hypothetical protein
MGALQGPWPPSPYHLCLTCHAHSPVPRRMPSPRPRTTRSARSAAARCPATRASSLLVIVVVGTGTLRHSPPPLLPSCAAAPSPRLLSSRRSARPSAARQHHLPAAPPQRPAAPAPAARPRAPTLRRMSPRVTPSPMCLSRPPPSRQCDRPSSTRLHHLPTSPPPRPAAPAPADLKAKRHLPRTRRRFAARTLQAAPLFLSRRRLSDCRCAGSR